jgi:O-acetylserine/cysteine efflux transporter
MPAHASARLATTPMSSGDLAAAGLVIVIWALNFVIGKLGLLQLPPLLMLSLRFGLVAVLLVPWITRPSRRQWPFLLALSVVLGTGHFGLMFVGLSGIGAGPAAIAIQLTIPFSAILAAVFFRERMSWPQMVGLLIAFVGVYLLAGEDERPLSLVHFLLVVAAALAWAGANVLIKRLGPINGVALNGWIALLATPQLLCASLLLETGQWQALRDADLQGWGAVLYMAVCSSIIAYGLWYRLIERFPMNRVVPMTLLAPVLAVIFAVWLLDEALTSRIVVGGLLTLAGVAMIELLRPTLAGAEPLT